MYPNHQQLDSKHTLLIDSSALPGRVCASLCCSSSQLPCQLLKWCHHQSPCHADFTPWYQESRSISQKSFCWLGRKTEIAFYQNEKGFLHGKQQKQFERGADTFILDKVFSVQQTEKPVFLPFTTSSRSTKPATFVHGTDGPRGHSSWSGDLAIPAWKFSNPSSGNLGCFVLPLPHSKRNTSTIIHIFILCLGWNFWGWENGW